MFIREMACISTQETHNNAIFENEIKKFNSKQLFAVEPKYEAIPKSLLRRMSKLVRMSVGSAMPLIESNNDIEGIIIGSSNGSVEHSLRFLNQIIDYNEGTLTPTDFVQSTSNTVSGTLALMGKITGYNNTHENQGLSFESVVLDAFLQFEEGEIISLLIGAGEELSQSNFNIDDQLGLHKAENIHTSTLLESKTKGSIAGEGVAMFIVDSEKTKNSIAEIVDVDMISHVDEDNIKEKIDQFLSKNNMTTGQIDAVFLGRNGDVSSDQYYDFIENNLFKEQHLFVYKHLTGEFYTVSAVGTWLAANLLNKKSLPRECVWRKSNKPIKNILIYNNYQGKQHGFILMRAIIN